MKKLLTGTALSLALVLLPVHSVLEADGVWAESLWLGEQACQMLGAEAVLQARQLLYAKQDPARPFISGRRARGLLARHVQNGHPVWAAAPRRHATIRQRATFEHAVEPA